jgi:hypothetical protein
MCVRLVEGHFEWCGGAGTEEEAVEELGWLEQADEGKWKIQGDVEVIQHVSCDPCRAKPVQNRADALRLRGA